ncbi:uncharacterized protein LOC112035295 [Quercus suber]|uniref:uncharacterized protein LOC112035295 n=1 Tax=Quercus suber TaxID=58331 RepID=UPI000CE180BD|nr:uncharacterized protein LOC112035295 [Quercus suber]POE96305.1 hypothetical protein CFP56_51830 [Quercus suber]
MVFKDYTFFSYVFLATAILLLTGHAHGPGLCDNSPHKQVCHSIVYNRTNPRDAVVAACHKLVSQTKAAKVVAQRQPNSTEIYDCITSFNVSIFYTKDALKCLSNNMPVFLSRDALLDAQDNYKLCDDGFQNSGKTNPIAKSTKNLQDMAYVGAYLTTLIK